eukprot:766802-Hanusia_phi.AAC.1
MNTCATVLKGMLGGDLEPWRYPSGFFRLQVYQLVRKYHGLQGAGRGETAGGLQGTGSCNELIGIVVLTFYLLQTKCSYTIIRPGGLQGLNNLVAVQGDTGYSDIDRADVAGDLTSAMLLSCPPLSRLLSLLHPSEQFHAEVAVASIFYPETAFTTFEVIESPWCAKPSHSLRSCTSAMPSRSRRSLRWADGGPVPGLTCLQDQVYGITGAHTTDCE